SAELALQHFQVCEIRVLANVLTVQARGSRRERADQFERLALQQGLTVARMETTDRITGASDTVPNSQMIQWLKQQPKPMGILAMDDSTGRYVIEACRLAGLRVPDDVAVLGHDNDQPLCEFCDPPLSSIAMDQRRIGYEAARLLDQLLQGQSPPAQPIRIPPLGIITRASTDVQHNEDPLVSYAMNFIRSHIAEGVTPTQVMRQVPASASTLQRRFREHRHQTIGHAIHQVRQQWIERLLIQDDRSLTQIAADAGYQHLSQFCRDFKHAHGITPSAFREKFAQR
ncbi:MAG: substrate-binding domain-containing protein, partial [Phycisphaerales bacterium]|nr:substrate-binding domain-containing protein [Phycisphaerales bacterium]